MRRKAMQLFTAVFCGVCVMSQSLTASAENALFGINPTAGITNAVAFQTAATAVEQSLTTNLTATSKKETAGVVNDMVVRIDEQTKKVSDTDIDTLGTGTTEEAAPAEEEEVWDFGYEALGICAIDSGYANIREQATTQSDIEGTLDKDAACEVLGEENGFYKVTSGDVEGYIREDLLLTGDEAIDRAKEVAEKSVEVTCDALRIREEQNLECKVLRVAYTGEKLPFEEDLGEWVRVRDGEKTGYVYAEYTKNVYSLKEAVPVPCVMVESNVYGSNGQTNGAVVAGNNNAAAQTYYSGATSGTRASLVNNALQYVGNPYVWGGTSLTNGADCSGFVMSIYAQYGISLPHSSAMQSQYGTRVNASQAQPGDLIFYNYGGSISHVAIYIGNGKIVHASDERTGIKVSNAFTGNVAAVTSLLGN